MVARSTIAPRRLQLVRTRTERQRTFSRRVRALRVELDLWMPQVADALGLPLRTWHCLEDGEVAPAHDAGWQQIEDAMRALADPQRSKRAWYSILNWPSAYDESPA